MSLERRSRIAGPRAIFRVRPHSLACDLLAQSGIRGRGPNRPWKICGDGCRPKGVALHGRNKIYGDGCHPEGMALHGQGETWTRQITVGAGSEVQLTATLEKAQ